MMKKTIFITTMILLAFLLVGCSKDLENSTRFYHNFDTSLVISIWDEKAVPEDDWVKIEEAIALIEETFDRHKAGSELYDLNLTAGTDHEVEVSQELFDVLKTALYFSDKTEGKFNPAIGPLMDLWGEILTEVTPPTVEEIEEILPLIDDSKIVLNEEKQTVKLKDEGMSIDLGAISKGYAADLLMEIIKGLGYKHAKIDLGTSSIAFIGKRHSENSQGNRNWTVAISIPGTQDVLGRTQTLGTIQFTDQTITSSGIDERYWIDADDETIHYHHILDSETGYPVDNSITQVTILSKRAMYGDVLSTAIIAVGIEKGLALVESLEGVEVIILDSNKKLHVSSGINEDFSLTITNDAYEIVNR